VGLSGLAEPDWEDAVRERGALFRNGSTWVIAYAASEEAKRAVASDSMYLSRLESEGWILNAY
jgi:hypothetical protein